MPVDYENLAKLGSIMGSGGLIVMDETTCMVDVAHYFLSFTQDESCGKCTPCRIGTRQMAGILERIKRGEGRPRISSKLEQLAETVRTTSLCGLGQTAPNPVLTTLRYFRDEYEAHVNEGRCPALSCKDLIYFEINEDCVGCGHLPEGMHDGRHHRRAEAAASDRPAEVHALRNLLVVCPPKIAAVDKHSPVEVTPVMIELVIDGNRLEVDEGASVLDAAREAKIFVPTLCYQRDLSAFGGCRMCIVEIEGMPGFPTSCTTQAAAGMVVRTDTRRGPAASQEPAGAAAERASQLLPDLRRQERPAGTATSARAGRRSPPDASSVPTTVAAASSTWWSACSARKVPELDLPSLYRAIPVDRRDPFIDRDDNLCILCGRCVRACAEQSFTCTLDIMHRGGEARVGTAFDRTLAESDCRFCGACVDACPTGTLAERARRWDGPAEERVRTTCSFCSVGCQFDFGVKNDRVIEAMPLHRMDGETGEREACTRGRFAVVEFVRSVRRLKTPLLRRGGALVEVPWETALEAVAEGIRSADP